MGYTLEKLSSDCRSALMSDTGLSGRKNVCNFIAKACGDPEFVETHLGAENTVDRQILYEDPDLKFCILAHVYQGPKESKPHDHGPSWAIYGQAVGVTEMTDWVCTEKPKNGNPGRVQKQKTYELTPGDAYLYNEGDLHSPRRTDETRLIRVEGINMASVQRDKYEVAA